MNRRQFFNALGIFGFLGGGSDMLRHWWLAQALDGGLTLLAVCGCLAGVRMFLRPRPPQRKP